MAITYNNIPTTGKWGDAVSPIEDNFSKTSIELARLDVATSTLAVIPTFKDPVATVSSLATTYPTPEKGWSAMVEDVGLIYQYNGTAWANTGLTAFPTDVATLTDLSGKVDKQVIYNVTQITGVTYADRTTARNAVTSTLRGLGQIIRYKLSTGWITEQYIGADLTGWATESNWRNNTIIAVNKPPYLGYNGETTGDQTQTTAGNKSIYLAGGVVGKIYTTYLDITFTSKTGLNTIVGLAGTTAKYSNVAGNIVLNSPMTIVWSGACQSDGVQNIISQFMTQSSGTTNVAYTINKLIVLEDVWTKSQVELFISNNYEIAGSAYQSAKSITADTSVTSTTSTTSTYSRLPQVGLLKPQNADQLIPQNWTVSDGGKFASDNSVTIKKVTGQNKISAPNSTVSGTKYIAIFNVYNLKFLQTGVNMLAVYNFTQQVMSIYGNGLYYSVFTANNTGASIQAILNTVDSGLADGTPLCSFNSDIMACVPYSAELEATLAEAQKNYNGGAVIPSQVLSALSIPKNVMSDFAKKSYVDTSVNALRDSITNNRLSTPYEGSFKYDVNHIIMYGQSLSVGGFGSNAASPMRRTLSFKGGANEWIQNVDINDPVSVANFYDTVLTRLQLINQNHPPVAAAGITWMTLLENENNIDLSTYDYQFIYSTPGTTGISISGLSKGTTYYNRLLFSIQKAAGFVVTAKKTFGVPVLFWVQGEADINNANYYNQMKQLFIDLNADIKAITGQSEDVQFVTYQTSPKASEQNYPSWAQIKISQDIPNVHFGGAMYQFEYEDDLHPLDRAIVGLQLGVQAKRVINDDAPVPVFFPKSHYIQNQGSTWLLNIVFDVPVPPMRFDISGDKWHNPNGKQTNFGFELKNSSNVNIITAEPIIRRGNTLIIACSENPTGAKLSYALSGHYGGGNLCDSQNLTVNNKQTDYVIDNFCPAFKDYIIG